MSFTADFGLAWRWRERGAPLDRGLSAPFAADFGPNSKMMKELTSGLAGG